jgi:hypothetical protein
MHQTTAKWMDLLPNTVHICHAGDYPLDMAKTYYAKKRLRYLRRACGL